MVRKSGQFYVRCRSVGSPGKHNTQNSLAAGIAGRLVEIRKSVVRESLEDFENVEHRLEFVAKVNGIENPNLISDFFEELGILPFNKTDFSIKDIEVSEIVKITRKLLRGK